MEINVAYKLKKWGVRKTYNNWALRKKWGNVFKKKLVTWGIRGKCSISKHDSFE